MFYEDYFHPTFDNDIEQQTTMSKKKENYNYEKYTITVNKPCGPNYDKPHNMFYKTVRETIEDFGSGKINSKIRNAVTGQKTQYLVGSANEDLFFKVRNASRVNGKNESLKLYYESPEQYERHHFVTVSPAQKEAWYNKYQLLNTN